ncbi:MAG: type IV pilus twitching motility protein PilT [Candidatus Omnitrophota bacterium]
MFIKKEGKVMPEIIELFQLIVERKASDLHLTAGLPPEIRVDGELIQLSNHNPLTPERIENMIDEILSEEQKKIFEEKKELDASYGIRDLSRFRINVFKQRGSIAVAVRAIPYNIPTIESLGLPEIVKEFAEKPNGLVLVTGATGSGKSTTLAAMIDYINERRKCHIISIEDPIEYLHRHKKSTINQRELGTDTLSFAEALKHVFRQDPDIVLIGELRDLETIQTALTLAETGHLIFGTLHTGSAANSIARIVDVFPAHQQQQIRVQLSLVLLGVIVQQLMPNVNGKGRTLAYEVMSVSSGIQNLIRENNLHQIYSAIQMGRKYGMCTMNHSMADLVNDGSVSYEEAMRRSMDTQELESLLLHR